MIEWNFLLILISADITKGQWSSWTECSATCNGKKTRHRICDFDAPDFQCTSETQSKTCSVPCSGRLRSLFHLYLFSSEITIYEDPKNGPILLFFHEISMLKLKVWVAYIFSISFDLILFLFSEWRIEFLELV